jgi:hypothetical protein
LQRTIQGTFLLSLVPIGPVVSEKKLEMWKVYIIPSGMSTADLTALDSQWKYALHYNCQVNYCHHLPSVVCKLFTFQASSPKPQGQWPRYFRLWIWRRRPI